MGEQLQLVARNLASLGPQRQLALALAVVTVIATVIGVSYLMSAPAMTVLYKGLNRTDITSISAVLSQSRIPFDVNAKGDGILVPASDITRARTLLAERRLPSGPSSGYELFDNLGSMGLTSFMQEVTRKRATEGELVRTIEAMRGVLAARVHLVMKNGNTFRRNARKPSASVVIRTTTDTGAGLAIAIRHLVAAAVPELSVERVSVLNTDGTLLASSGEGTNEAPGQHAQLEAALGTNLESKVRETLAPFLGVTNFRISVTARLNTDKLETRETAFDPETRVERSRRIIKETKSAENSAGQKGVSVEQNLPAEEPQSSGGRSSKESGERREELTNFEVGSTTVAKVSNGYRIERLSVAVLVNQQRIENALGKEANPETIRKMLGKVEALAGAAVGIDAKRGDEINVSAAEFLENDGGLEAAASPSIMLQLAGQFGTLINGIVAIGIVLLVIMLAIRPISRTLMKDHGDQRLASAASAGSDEDGNHLALASDQPSMAPGFGADPADIDMSLGRTGNTWGDHKDPKERLAQLTEDEEATARVMREWLQEERV